MLKKKPTVAELRKDPVLFIRTFVDPNYKPTKAQIAIMEKMVGQGVQRATVAGFRSRGRQFKKQNDLTIAQVTGYCDMDGKIVGNYKIKPKLYYRSLWWTKESRAYQYGTLGDGRIYWISFLFVTLVIRQEVRD